MKASTKFFTVKSFAIPVLVLITTTMVLAAPPVRGGDTVEEWFRKLPNARQKLTKLRFYSHENIYSKNPTAVRVAKPDISDNVTTLFGLVMVVDHLLTAGPEPGSEAVGRAQGTYASASRMGEALLTAVSFVFTRGKYEGSSLSVVGRNPIFEELREMPVVGGSGVFRLARGTATAETYTFDASTGDPVVEYSLIVLHY